MTPTNPPTGDTKSEGILHLPEDEQKALFTEAANKSSKRQAETMNQSEIRKVLARFREEHGGLYTMSYNEAEALIEAEVTRRVVEARIAEVKRPYGGEEQWKLALEANLVTQYEVDRIAQLTQEKKG